MTNLAQQASDDTALFRDIERITETMADGPSTAADAIQDLFVAWLGKHDV